MGNSKANNEYIRKLLRNSQIEVMTLDCAGKDLFFCKRDKGEINCVRLEDWGAECSALDISSLGTMLRNCAEEGKDVDMNCEKPDGTVKRVAARKLFTSADKGDTVVVVAIDTSVGGKAEVYETKKSTCSQITTFELDLNTNKVSLSENFPKLYMYDEQTMVDLPMSAIKNELVKNEYHSIFISMFDNLHKDKKEGSGMIEILSRERHSYVKVCIIWKKIFDDHGNAVKVVGVIEPLGVTDGNISAAEREELMELRAKLALQEKYFKRAEEYQRVLRRYRHDSKNNVIALSALIKDGDLKGAQKYIESLGFALNNEAPLVKTGNAGIDALLSEKIREAQKRGISVDHMVGLPMDVEIDSRDLCLAVGCCMDNAIEACTAAREKFEDVSIMLRLIERRGIITFRMVNTSVTPQLKPFVLLPDTTKKDTLNHGFGMKNVADIVRKYNGYLSARPEEGNFVTEFTLLLFS